MRTISISVVCASSILVVLVGCSSAPAGSTLPGDQGSQSDPTKPSTPTKKNGDPGSNENNPNPNTNGDGGTAPTTTCGAKATQDACYECCEAVSSDVSAAVKAEEAIDLEWQQCACAAARCGTACATDYCAPGADPSDDATPGSACEACLDGTKTDACDDQTDPKYEALEKTPGYVAWEKCDLDSKCASLPE
jgi:hypothetical protein